MEFGFGSKITELDFGNEPPPKITIDRSEVEDRTNIGGGPTLMVVNIVNADGTTGRFFVTARIVNNRPQVHVTGLRHNSESHGFATAAWRL